MQKRRRLQMKNKKETEPTTEKEREDFWLEIGPASAYYGTDSYETAKENGDASPDGKAGGLKAQSQKKSKINFMAAL